MQFSDQGVVLSTRRFAENNVVARLFTLQHGMCGGVVRAATSKATRGVYQPGNLLIATWNARLSEHLGSWRAELAEPWAALVMQDAVRLQALSAACSLIEVSLPEREPHPELYHLFRELMRTLASGEEWYLRYAQFELALLENCGFQLDLSSCAATGATSSLIYVSPKSGRAVSATAGAPYADKLFALPGFLRAGEDAVSPEGLPATDPIYPSEILASLRITGYFLLRWLLEPHGRTLPAARQRLVQQLEHTMLLTPAHGT